MAMMEQLLVKLGMDASGYISEAKQAAHATDRIAQDAKKAGRDGSSAMGGLSSSVKKLGGLMAGAFAAQKVSAFIGDAVNAAADLGESINAVSVVFGSATQTLLDYGETAATSVGLAKTEFNSLATNTGALLTNFGFTQQQAADEAINLTERAADMASVFNTDVGDALFAVQAALRGETEPIRRFGVSLDDASIRAKAVEMGLAATTAEVDKNAKATAALQLVYDQTAKVQGDFANTSDSLANQQRILAAEFENAKAEIGEGLLPVANQIVGAVRDMLPALVDAGKAFGGVVAAAAPLVGLLMKAIGPALQGVAKYLDLVADGATAIQSLFSDDAKAAMRFDEALENVQDTIKKGGDGAVAYANGLVHMAGAGALTTERMSELGSGVEFVGEQQAVAIKMARDWAIANGASADQIAVLNEALWNQAVALSGTGEVFEDTAAELGLMDLWQEKTAASADDVAAASEDAGKAAGEAADGYQEAAGEAKDLATQLVAAADAQESLADVLKAAADPAFAAVKAWQDYQEVLAEVDEDGRRSAEEQLELAEAILEAQGALDAFTAGGVEDAAQAIATALGVGVDEARELLAELGVLDGKTVTTIVDIQVPGSAAARAARDASVTTSGRTAVSGRAAGGPVTGGTPYLVGEAGPELFVPQTSGTIVPNSMMSAVGGRTTNITFVNPQLANDPMQGVRAALAFDRLEAIA